MIKKVYTDLSRVISRERSRSGYTLIETVVVIGIFSIILSMIGSQIVTLLHVSYKLALQRQINREARNVTEQIVREGRLARGATEDEENPMRAIDLGSWDAVAENWVTVADDINQSEDVRFQEVPKLAKIFAKNGSDLGIVELGYNVNPVEVVRSADIMILLDRSTSMDTCPSLPCTTNLVSAKEKAELFVRRAIEAGDSLFRIGIVAYGSGSALIGGGLTDELQLYLNDPVSCDNSSDFSLDCFLRGGSHWDTTPFDSGDGNVTNIAGAFLEAKNELITTVDRPDADKYIILMSDGAQSSDVDFENPPNNELNLISPGTPPAGCDTYNNPEGDPSLVNLIELTNCEAEIARNIHQIKTYSVAFANGAGTENLREVAGCPATGDCSTFYFAEGADQLEQAFLDILQKILDHIDYEVTSTLESSASSVALYRLTDLDFTSNTDRTWLGIEMLLEAKITDEPYTPPWAKAKIKTHTFFTSRNY